MVCGTGKDDFKYEGIIKSYELMAEDRKWKNLGHYIAPDVTKVGDIVKTDHLEYIKKIGQKI